MIEGRKLSDKVALITGAAAGMGAATAAQFAKHGAVVAVTDIKDAQGRGVADRINAAGGTAFYLHLDTTDGNQWTCAVIEILASFARLDILAGLAGSSSHQLGIEHVTAPMCSGGGGSIINVSSIKKIHAVNAADQASKGAVRSCTEAAAIRCAGDNIRVNSVHPGFARPFPPDRDRALGGHATPISHKRGIGRLGKLHDIAMGCLFLASDDSAWMTGSELVIDGAA